MKPLLYAACAYFVVMGLALVLAVFQKKRATLLLPAAAYGISGFVGFFALSWWSLAVGYSLVRFLRAYGFGLEPEPVERPKAIGMLVNHGIHLVAGALAPGVFNWSGAGLVNAALLAFIIQGGDALGDYFIYRRLLADAQPKAKSSLPYKFAQIFVFKVFWYGGLTLIAAWVVRSLT